MHRHPTQHPNQTKNDGPITYRVIKEFKRESRNIKNPANMISYRVIQWCKQDHPTLEKRRVYVRQDGSLKTEKIVGFTLIDLQWFLANAQEIADAMQ